MRVLHLISSSGMYGAEAVILNLARALDAGGEHHSMLGVFDNSAAPNHELYTVALAQGLDAHLVPCRGQFDRSVPARIRNLAQRANVDLIHAHGYKADIYAYLAKSGTQVPLVSTCHNWIENDFTVRLYGSLDRFILRRFNAVAAVSNDVRDRLLKAGVASKHIHVIRNGIDLGSFRHIAEIRKRRISGTVPIRIGLVGRLSEEKGVDVFLRAASEIPRGNPEPEFVVAGEGPDRAALERLIAELGLNNRVALLGHTTDMPDFYGSVDVLVSASRTEGLPMVLLEGMASGLAPVATAVGAVPQVVRDSETGLLVAPNDPAALALAMQHMIEDPRRREILGQNAQKLIAKEFSAEQMAAEYIEMYERVCAPKRSREVQPS